ncbi:MAG: hypothetical protein AAGF29_04595, partial [Pseudomonadota bacterium]
FAQSPTGSKPLNGLRHLNNDGTSGWYIWSGEFSYADGFFQPMCASHLVDECPACLEFLGLAAGWRFLVNDGYEDVWYDKTLLDT